MSLDIQIKKPLDPARQDTVTVELAGSLDTATAPALEHGLQPLLADGTRQLVFDLAGLKFVSSAGLRVFGMARKRLRETGGQVCFVHMQPQIEEVFEIIKALPGLGVFRNTAELDEYLAARQLRDRDED
jgi:anti-sigma B factor antagonist